MQAMQERAMLCRISATVAQAPHHSHAIATLRNRLCLQGRGLNVSTLTLGSLSHKRVCWGPRPQSGRLLVTGSLSQRLPSEWAQGLGFKTLPIGPLQ